MGADVRLVVPGDGCLLCAAGSFSDYAHAVTELGRPPAARPWEAKRAGSSRFLNQVPAGFAGLLVEQLVRGEVRGTTWIQVTVDPTGRWSVSYPPCPKGERGECALCRRAALGDLGLPAAR
jgi:hypothetical protein